MYFLNINKPLNITSFDVIKHLRKVLKIKQIGHFGTLDPLAEGVLVVAVGAACKLLEYLDSDKKYIADIKFGYNSTTYDNEGEKTFIKTPDFKEENLKQCLNTFVGKIKQIPPMYSAIKIDGKKLYNLARKNIEIEIPAREIEIYNIKLLNFNGFDEAKIEVHCSKGTYIRSLAFDIGKMLSCGAYLAALKRIESGSFNIKDSNNLTDTTYKKINPIEVLPFKKYELNDEEHRKIMNGNYITCNNLPNDEKILLTKNNILVSIANLSDNLIKPKKNFKGNIDGNIF